jgi:hypothetical protein
MSDIEIDVDVSNNTALAGPALKQGLEDGLQDAGEWLLEKGEDQAKDAVLSADRVWRGTLKEGFRTRDKHSSDFYSWNGEIINDAPHARVNEEGRKPGNAPAVQDIIAWVDDKVVEGNPDTESNVENWNPQLQGLAASYSPGTVVTAFAVKEGLEDNGYPGIGFMETTEAYLEGIGPMIVERKVEKHINRELRKAGLQ